MSISDDRLQVGSIIFEYVTNTTPHKEKYYIVIGFSDDKVALGTVFINSEINPNIFRNEKQRKLHIPFSQNDNPFLKWDSYIDCSNIHVRPIQQVQECIAKGGNYGYIATLSISTLQEVISTLDSAFTISPAMKKTFGIRKEK